MKELLGNMFRRTWQLLVACPAAWDAIASERPAVQVIRSRYVYPWVGVCVCASFVCGLLYASEGAFEAALSHAIATGVSLLGGYFACKALCQIYLRRSRPDLDSKADCETVVAYAYTVILCINLLTTVMPSLFFLKALTLYAAYLVWEACRAVWLLRDEERGNIVLAFTLVLVLVPVAVGMLVHWMLPNI